MGGGAVGLEIHTGGRSCASGSPGEGGRGVKKKHPSRGCGFFLELDALLRVPRQSFN